MDTPGPPPAEQQQQPSPLPRARWRADPVPPYPDTEIVGPHYCKHNTYAPNGIHGFGFSCPECSIEAERKRLGFWGRLAREVRFWRAAAGSLRYLGLVLLVFIWPLLLLGAVALIVWLVIRWAG
jgi:hypothetical protein